MSELRKLVDAVREAMERDGAELSVARYIGGGEYLAEDTTYGTACEALSDALLAHPEWVEALDALAEWGEARQVDSWGQAEADAYRRAVDVADRLHAARVYAHMTAPTDEPVASGGVDDTEERIAARRRDG